MKMQTPFTGKLAVLRQTSRAGHFMSLNGAWALKPGAVVYHQTRIGELEFGSPTVIGEIQRLEVRMDGRLGLYARGLGTTWLAEILDEGTHALSMEMDMMRSHQMTDKMLRVDSGRVRGALLVRADAFGWAGQK